MKKNDVIYNVIDEVNCCQSIKRPVSNESNEGMALSRLLQLGFFVGRALQTFHRLCAIEKKTDIEEEWTVDKVDAN